MLSLGSAISFALAKHMIETNNKKSFLRFLVEMGRGPPHLKGFFHFLSIY